jgi:hypothetical protein
VEPDDSSESASLPNAESAYVPEEKLRGYILNPDHADGTHKCRVFRSVFGIGPDDWELLQRILVEGIQGQPIKDVRHRHDCSVYGVQITLGDLNGHDREIHTSWKVPRGGGAPVFVTAYLDIRGGRHKLES